MIDKFQNRYRIKPARASWWDYANQAAYFVTICTQKNQHFFGEVADEGMRLFKIGKIVESEWLKTPELRPDMNLELGPFVVMPNHFHSILMIGENKFNIGRDAMHGVSTVRPSKRPGPQVKNLSSIIRGFKSAVTKAARQIQKDFAWQARFHDHIIRDETSLETISQYIICNPQKWTDDKYYIEETAEL